MAYSEQIKNEVLQMIAEGKRVQEISEITKVPKSTIYRWKSEAEKQKENLEEDANYGIDTSEEIEASKKIEIAIKEWRFEDAKEIGATFPNSAIIQSQMITIAIKERRLDDAKEIGARFPNSAIIQSQMITIAIKEGRLDDTKEIGARFSKDSIIQSQMMTIAIKEGRLDDAKAIGDNFLDSVSIQSQMIAIAIKEGRLDDAKVIGDRFSNDESIQSQMITIAIKERKLDDAKKIGNNFPDSVSIQSQMITIAIKEGMLDYAKEIGARFPNSARIQSQMITIAIKEGRLDDAKEIGARFSNDESIQSQLASIQRIESSRPKTMPKNTIFTKGVAPKEEKDFINRIKTKLYFGKIDDSNIEQIVKEIKQNEKITEYRKTIILLAIYENLGKVKSIKSIKKDAKNNPDIDKALLPIINTIFERSKQKKQKPFDWGYYDEKVGWTFDQELMDRYNEEARAKKMEQPNTGNGVTENDSTSEKIGETARTTEESYHAARIKPEKNESKRHSKNGSGLPSAKKPRNNFVEQLQAKTPNGEGSSNDIEINYLTNRVKEILDEIPIALAKRCHTLNQTQDLSDRKKLLEQIDKIHELPERLNKHLKIAKGSKDSEERKASIAYLKNKISLYERIKSQRGAGR